MGVFSRVPAIDPAYGDPRARALVQALRERDRDTVAQVFAGAGDRQEHAVLMEVAAEVPGVQEWIGDWVAAEPDATLPRLVQGCHAVTWAWEARGARLARFTRQKQFQEFFRRLRIAEAALTEVVTRDPDEVTAWTWLTTSARGRQAPPNLAAARFAQVTDRVPDHQKAHEQRLQYLCAKWLGSHAEMFAFARAATARAKPGGLLPELLVTAHFEYWLSLSSTEDTAYITSAPVRADLATAADASLLHPDFTPVLGWQRRANTFAMVLAMAGDHDRAARVFALIGDQVTAWPWSVRTVVGRPAAKFAAARREVLSSARRAS